MASLTDGMACLSALRECHDIFTQRLDIDTSQNSAIDTDLDHFMRAFASQAERKLSPMVYDALVRFLKNPISTPSGSQADLKRQVAERYEKFIEEEITLTGEARDRLAAPSGPPDANLGLILHIQSEENTIGEFWDNRSASIRLLQEKGISPTQTFCYDWHWRAESTFHGRTTCPMKARPKVFQQLHDAMSADMLKLLPLPFLIIASACARDTYRRKFSQHIISFDVELESGSGVLRFDLEYRNTTVTRIIAHSHHPAAAFFVGKAKKKEFGLQLDISFSFMLWLTGQISKVDSFRCQYASSGPPRHRAAPLRELWKYRALELAQGQNLKIHELSLPFIGWATRYLDQDLSNVSIDGTNSIIHMIVKKIGCQISKSRYRYIERKRQQQESCTLIAGTLDVKAANHSKRRKGTKIKQAAVDAEVPNSVQTSLLLSADASQAGYTRAQSARVDAVGPLPVQQSEISRSHVNRAEFLECNTIENPTFETIGSDGDTFEEDVMTTLFTVNDGITTASAVDDINDAQIPIPFDDQYEDEIPTGREIGIPDPDDHLDRKSLSGRLVQFKASAGTVILQGADCELRFGMAVKKAKMLVARRGPVKIQFTENTIELQIDLEKVYEKSYERLLCTSQDPEWLCQIICELTLLYKRESPRIGLAERLQSGSLKIGAPLGKNCGSMWKAGELRRRLLQGAPFSCAMTKNGTDMGRVIFREVAIFVPKEADFETVHIQCFLEPQGSCHSSPCCYNAQADDPAMRLGIQVRFTSTRNGNRNEVWASLKDDKNVKKVNSLVDFLEEREESWTESQPRRYLARSVNRGRTKALYT